MQAKRTAVVMKESGGEEAARAEEVVVCSGFGVTGVTVLPYNDQTD
jgi:hypothetical protein